MGYDKAKALNVIVAAAKIYDNTLNGKELLFITKQDKKIVFYEMQFHSRNFKHFTGVDTQLSAERFYQKAINRRLSIKDFRFKDAFLVEKKMNVLQNAVKLPFLARMVGDFNYAGIKIQADIGSGTTNYTMAFRRDKNEVLYPVSVLDEDIRKATKATSPVVAILSRDIGTLLYDNLTYKSKNINFKNMHIPKDLRDMIESNILEQFEENI